MRPAATRTPALLAAPARIATPALLAALALFAAPAPAAAQAWLKWDVAARPMGMGGAAAALDDAASAAWYDPAGIATLVGTRISAGGSLSLRSGEVDAVGLGEFDRESETLADGYLHVVHPLAADLTGGLSVVSPWEISTAWDDPETFPGRFHAFRTRLRSLDVSPVLAWRARPDLAVAAGVHVAWARLELGRFEQDPDLSALGGLGPIALARSDVEMDGTGVGWVAGVHWRPIPAVALAAHARGPVGLDLSGVVDFTGTAPASLRDFRLPTGEETVGELLDATYVDQAARTRIELPALAAAGVAWDPFDRVRLAATVQWAGWGAVDDLELAFADTILADAIPLDYENAWSLRLGAEVRHSPALFVRVGFAHEESPAPTVGVGPILPDADRNALTAGLGIVRGEFAFDVAWRVAFLEDREGVALPESVDVDGVYGGTEHRLSFGVSRDL